MNRHHYALFVRNCRLILLLRRDFSEGDLNIFRPAEWRWKLPQVSSFSCIYVFVHFVHLVENLYENIIIYNEIITYNILSAMIVSRNFFKCILIM